MCVKENQILNIFPNRIRERFVQTASKMDELQEIRLQAGGPVRALCGGREFFVTVRGELTRIMGGSCWYMTPGEMEHITLPRALLDKASGTITVSIREVEK